MIPFNKLRAIAPLWVALLLLPAGGLEAGNRKADKLYKLGAQAEARKDYDQALEYYQEALKLDPKDASYELAARRTRFESSTAHVEAGNNQRKAGDLEKALAEFQKAFDVNPGSMIALQDMQQTKELLTEKQKLPPGQLPLTSAEKAEKESLAMIQSLQPVPELKPVTNQISLLKMNNQPPKVLYETVGKLAGINVLFDPQMQPGKNANLDLNNVTLQEALDYIALLTKTFWKPVSSNAIFVTEDNVTKRRDYEDEVVKVFYLKNPTTTQEFSEIVTAVRSVTDVRRMYQFNAENAIVVRDTVDKVALVEKLLHDLDKPKAEVVIDVIVMDVASDVSRQIGAGLVSNGTNGLAVPFAFSPRNPVTSSTDRYKWDRRHRRDRHEWDQWHRHHRDPHVVRLYVRGSFAAGSLRHRRFFHQPPGRDVAGRDVGFQNQNPGNARGSRLRRPEGGSKDRREVSLCNRQFPTGCRYGRG